MRTTSYGDLRRHLAATLDRVHSDHEPVIITRDHGEPAAVPMSLEDFTAFEETVHLLRRPRNAERLLASISALSNGEGTEQELHE